MLDELNIVDLKIKWTNPIKHEKFIYKVDVNELYHNRILITLSLELIISIAIIIGFDLNFSQKILVIFSAIIIFLLTSPFFMKVWEIVLSNKRLILRNKYLNVGRFSSLISFNLNHLDTQISTPRIKVIPLITGFSIMFSYTIPLLEFHYTGKISLPMLVKIFFIFDNFIKTIDEIEQIAFAIMNYLLTPFYGVAIVFSLISGIISILLIVFGLPRRTTLIISSTGGHKLSINTGIPKKLSEYLSGIGRKHRVVYNKDWTWDLPLLDGEIIQSKAAVGLIDRKTQILGVISLLLSLESFNRFIVIFKDPSMKNFILLLITITNLSMMIISISFAKKFSRICTTNHRIMYQDERKVISGIYGKRIYSYSDLPYENIRGFSYSNYSGLEISIIPAIFLIISAGFSFSLIFLNNFVFIISIYIAIIFFALNYRTYTNLSFASLSGKIYSINYRLLAFMVSISHRIEKIDNLYNRLFPNLLSEGSVQKIVNNIHGVNNPVLDMNIPSLHEIDVHAFIDKDEEIIGKWEKMGHHKYHRESIILGFVISLITMIIFTFKIARPYNIVFLVFSLLMIIYMTIQKLVIRYNSFILLKNRLLYVVKTTPRNFARVFGILPVNKINGVNLEHLNLSRFKIIYGQGYKKLSIYLIIITLCTLFFVSSSNDSNVLLENAFYITIALVMIFSIFNSIQLIALLIPRYGLSLYTRFGEIMVSYIKDPKDFNIKLSKARGLS